MLHARRFCRCPPLSCAETTERPLYHHSSGILFSYSPSSCPIQLLPRTRVLGHCVQSAAVLEPLELRLVEGVAELDVECLAAGCWVYDHRHWLTNCNLGALQVNAVVWLDLVVVCWVAEGQRKHTLLLQVGLVDTCEGSGDDCETTKMSWLESSVLTGRALAVVPVANDNPLDASLLVVTGNSWDSVDLTSLLVLDLVGLAVGLVDGTDKHVVRNVVQVTTVLQPRTSHRDVISGSLALSLDQDWDVLCVLTVPCLEWLEDLETVGLRGDGD